MARLPHSLSPVRLDAGAGEARLQTETRLKSIEDRLNLAGAVFADMMWLWKDKSLRLNLKLRLLVAAVCSVLSYGFESWLLTEKAAVKLRHWTAGALAHLTGRTREEEYKVPTIDTVLWLRLRRLKWVGHVLRLPSERLVKKVMLAKHAEQLEKYGCPKQGEALMDVPQHSSIEELLELAEDREGWRAYRFQLRDKLSLKSPVQWNGTGVRLEWQLSCTVKQRKSDSKQTPARLRGPSPMHRRR